MASSSDNDAATVIAIGALAATLAAVSHETLGHGLSCVGIGGQVTLLTSIWFRCSQGAAITSAGGPTGNLVVGSLALILLRYAKSGPTVRLLLLMLGALNLFWFMGQLVFESLMNSHEDWYFTALQSGWPAIWRPVAIAVGIGGYALVRRLIGAVVHHQADLQARAIRLAYAAAAASALIAGLLWRPEPFRSAAEGLLCLGIAPFGLLGAARTAGPSASFVPRSWTWICASAAITGAFLFVQARGLGSMAGSALPH